MSESANGHANGQPESQYRQRPDNEIRACINAALMEAADQFVGMIGGPFDQFDLFNDVNGAWAYGNGPFIPPYYWQNQKRGEVIPVYLNELQLRWIRDRQRRLGAENPFMQGAVANVQNYCVGETGLKFEAVPAKNRDASPSHIRQTQRILDLWEEANDLPDYAAHLLETGITNGDAITRHFPQDDGIVLMRPVESEHMRSPAGDGYGAHYSFGIQTSLDDIEDVEGYWIVENPLERPMPVFVPAAHITFIKFNTPRSAKRGLPLFYSSEVLLRGAMELLRATMATVTMRAKIALIRKFNGVVKDAAKKLVQGLTTQTITDPGNGQQMNMQKFPYGAILNSSEGVEHEFPSQNFETDIHKTALYMVLRTIAVRAVLPEWMLTGDSSSGTYDNAFIAESPSTKSLGRIQETMCRRIGSNRNPKRRSMAWVQVVHAVKCGLLPDDVLHTVQIQTTGPKLKTRDEASEAATNKTYFDMRIKPPQMTQAELGIDPKIAEKQWDEWDAREEKRQQRQMALQQKMQPQPSPPSNREGEGRETRTPPAGNEDDDAHSALQESEQGAERADVDTEDLAHFYAELWDKRQPAEIGEQELATADAELAHGPHGVNWDDAAGWHVVSPAAVLESALLEAVHRAPKGGVSIKGKAFRGGMFIPAGDYANASAEEKAAIDKPAEASAAKRKARDPGKLRDKLKDHAHHELTAQEKTAARRSLSALQKHHGELTAHRLDELADQLAADLAKTPAEQEGRRTQLSRRLKAIEHQVDFLEQKTKNVDKPAAQKPLSDAKPPNTLYKRIREGGGIDIESVKGQFDVKTDFIESGLLGLLVGDKGKANLGPESRRPRGLDQWAETLQHEGHIQVPHDRNPDDFLLELLKTKALSLHDDVQSQLEKAEAEYARELEEAKNAGADQTEIEEALRAGQEEGRARGAAIEDQEGLGELADEEGFHGDPDDLTFDPAEFDRPELKPISPAQLKHARAQLSKQSLGVKGDAASPFITSDLSGHPIRRHVELPGGARVHPDELHRAVVNDNGQVELHPHEKIDVADPLNKGKTQAKSFAQALQEVTAYKGHDEDPITLQSAHGYSATKTRGEWRKIALGQPSPSMAVWYDRENPPQVSEAAKAADQKPKTTMAGTEETADFFKPDPEQKKLFDPFGQSVEAAAAQDSVAAKFATPDATAAHLLDLYKRTGMDPSGAWAVVKDFPHQEVARTEQELGKLSLEHLQEAASKFGIGRPEKSRPKVVKQIIEKIMATYKAIEANKV